MVNKQALVLKFASVTSIAVQLEFSSKNGIERI